MSATVLNLDAARSRRAIAAHADQRSAGDIAARIRGGERLYTTAEIAKHLRISTATVRRRRKDGMPYVEIAPTIFRFFLADCLAWQPGGGETAPTESTA